MKTPMVSKNRVANELREQAHKLRSELMDASVQFTAEEVEKRTSDIRALEMRAQAAAEFTPDAEIARQGGDAELTRFDVADKNEFRNMKDAKGEMRREVIKSFGSIGSYIRAVAKGAANNVEAEALRKLDVMTRTITGSTNGGEFLLPLTQEPDIFSVSNTQVGLFQFAKKYNVPGRTLRIPYLIQDEGTSTLNRTDGW